MTSQQTRLRYSQNICRACFHALSGSVLVVISMSAQATQQQIQSAIRSAQIIGAPPSL